MLLHYKEKAVEFVFDSLLFSEIFSKYYFLISISSIKWLAPANLSIRNKA